MSIKFEKNNILDSVFLFGMAVLCISFVSFTIVLRLHAQQLNIENSASKPSISDALEISSTSSASSAPNMVMVDLAGERITSTLQSAGIDLGFISSKNISDLGQSIPISISEPFQQFPVGTFPDRIPLSNIISSSESSKIVRSSIKNRLVWSKYNVDAPIEYASFSDFYNTREDGFIDFTSYRDTSSIQSPVQTKLKNGVVHLPISPLPGEIGNSYIVGHSSNYSNVESNYNEVFAPLLNSVSIGEEFNVYNHEGFALTFKVFDTKVVLSNESNNAYSHLNNKRTLTLQASILELVNGSYQPTKRYLVQAELIQP